MKLLTEIFAVIILTLLGLVCLILVTIRYLAWDWWHERPHYWRNQ